MYEIRIQKKVIKYLATLRKKGAHRILSTIEKLSANTGPAGSKKLAGEEAYRI